MIIFPPFSLCNHSLLSKISIPTHDQFPPSFIKKASFLIFFLLYIIPQSLTCSLNQTKFQTLGERTMKVHPLPNKRNNTTFHYYFNNNVNNQRNPSSGGSHKKLRRLPHIFNCVLELPFSSDVEVSVEEWPDCFRFVAETDVIAGGVRAHMVEIHPGVTKIVVRANGYLGFSTLDGLELDMWRFRLPETTRPELATAVFVDGVLVVTVPKGEEEEDGAGNGGGERIGGVGNNNGKNVRLVLVQ